MWFAECPHFDDGLIRPMVASTGVVVLMCDSGGEVWLDPAGVAAGDAVTPGPPEWQVADGITIAPGTTRWATPDDLPAEWRDLDWQD